MANLAALLDQEVRAEIEAILSEAQARASEIIADAQTEADESLKDYQRRAKQQHEAALVRAKSAAQLEASSLKLRAQHSAVEGVLASVRSEIDALAKNKKKYEAVLQGLVSEALNGLGSGDKATLIVNPEDRSVAEKIAQDLGIDKVETSSDVRAGIQLKAGNVLLENTLYGRLEALQDELASDISKVLFGSGEA